jgi:hypothetical protein
MADFLSLGWLALVGKRTFYNMQNENIPSSEIEYFRGKITEIFVNVNEPLNITSMLFSKVVSLCYMSKRKMSDQL